MKHLQFLFIATAVCACRSSPSSDDARSNRSSQASSEQAAEPKSSSSSAVADASSPKGSKEESVSDKDRDFVAQAIQGGLFEIESSRLALEKSGSPAIREFAQMMVDDHGKANQKLKDLAELENATAPTEMSSAQSGEIDELRRLAGVEFDRRYHRAQMDAHDKAIEAFDRASRECDASSLRDFATSTLPKLREHRLYLDQHPL